MRALVRERLGDGRTIVGSKSQPAHTRRDSPMLVDGARYHTMDTMVQPAAVDRCATQ